MALSDDELGLVNTLSRDIQRGKKRITRYDRYLEGEQPLRYMAPQLEAEVGMLVTQLVINWPMLVVDAYETRLDIVGFRYAMNADRDPQIWEWWDLVDGEELSQLAHFEALGLSRCYAIVGSGDQDDDPPVLTIEHPFEVATLRDPRTREVEAGLKTWTETDKTQHAQLYLPDSTVTLEKKGRNWVEEERDDHELGEVPVVPIVHRGRILRPEGRSIFHDVIPLADAANKMATDMMVSGEFHAMPRRWAIGVDQDDFVDEHGKQMDTWSMVNGRMWATEKKKDEVEFGQFPESELTNFHNTLRLLAALVAQLAGLPQDYLGFTMDNPPSAESRKASEVQLIKRSERIQTPFGGSWERVARLFLRFTNGGDLPENAQSLKTVWRDPSTPTRAQLMDAVTKAVAANVIPVEQARIDLGYDEEERRRMREMDAEVAARAQPAPDTGAVTPPEGPPTGP